MLSESDRVIAKQLKGKLQEITPVLKLVIYGSRARGNFFPDSDLDVYMEVPEITPDLRREISGIAWEVGFENGVIISTFVVTPFDIEEGPIGASPLINAVKSEGIPV